MAKTRSRSTTTRTKKAAPREMRSPFRPILPLAVTLIIVLGLILLYVSLDTKIEQQAKSIVAVEGEITNAEYEYNAELNTWQQTLQPRNLEEMMRRMSLDMRFPPPTQRIELSNHQEWVRRQTAKASVVRAGASLDSGALAAAEDPLPPPPEWARQFLKVSTR